MAASARTFSHGIHPPESKELTAASPVRRLPFPPVLVILMAQHAGKPAVPVVREGQRVRRGELLARADGFVSVPIHAPADGVIRSIGRALDTRGQMAPALYLEPDPASTQTVKTGHPVDPESLDASALRQAVQDMGMVGLGGAAFPTHVKLSPPAGKTIHTLIVNGCECEPYLTSDHRVMLEYPAETIAGCRLLLRATGATRALIGVEDNKPDAIALLREHAAGDPAIQVQALVTKYPQGAEKMLTRALLGKDIPSGGLPADIGVVVSNVATVAEIGMLLPRGEGLIERVVTVSGEGVERPGNYLVPVGTPLRFILEHTGLRADAGEVIFGGPMMGAGVAWLETPTTKGVTGIVVMARHELPARAETVWPCIRCSSCVQACPIHLNPSRLGLLARKGRYSEMKDTMHLFDCFECGCCSYVCPSRIPLVQQFRLAKQMLREAGGAR
jgi:electron transport complex protein RnfC